MRWTSSRCEWPIATDLIGRAADCGSSNEAFASQAVYSVEKLKIPLEKVNPVGG